MAGALTTTHSIWLPQSELFSFQTSFRPLFGTTVAKKLPTQLKGIPPLMQCFLSSSPPLEENPELALLLLHPNLQETACHSHTKS